METNIQWNQKQREKDEYLMDIARKQGYNQKHMKQINQVRMYLKVITLADITEEMGTHIEASCFEWKKSCPINTNWKIQGQIPKPNREEWHRWKTLLKTKLITKTRRLKEPLGNWTKKWNEIRKNYRIYSDGKSVFERQNDIFKKINLTSNSKTQVNGPTKEAVPAIITASKTIINKNQIQNKEKTKNTTKNNIEVPKEFIIVSDASVHQPNAAWAWVASDKEGKIISQQSAKIQEQNISSYRAEAIGILYAIKFIQQHQENIQKWTLYCDNQALINRLAAIEN